jgi:hypothetical protein
LPVASKDAICPSPLTDGNRQLATLSLLLFMLHVRADDPNDAFSADDLAVFADPPDAGSNFHDDHLVLAKTNPNRSIRGI